MCAVIICIIGSFEYRVRISLNMAQPHNTNGYDEWVQVIEL